ncbi:Na(+)/H(+) antiporter subunit C [Buchananella hordeovulneris]|uniref:Na(+)/H(+) antiporter subunit C n=1 Tax=Buchananella hordeovulneris TaxID=52770 RepID=A0A1Q5PUW7_9ACTO|nr:Na(+)/H(+) antiporter subunit C [Buchananella hordeovulneris]OKL51358.1 hypothetical protein BSZ40_07225 [Buchananella hordeovulneris]
MTGISLVLLLLAGVLVSVGIYMVLERTLTRIIIGLAILSNGVNVLFLVAGGAAGNPPLLGTAEIETMSDPLPQAMVLTAIVITLGMTAFLLALALRAAQVAGDDEVVNDVEDRRVARLAARVFREESHCAIAAEVRDETDDEPAVDPVAVEQAAVEDTPTMLTVSQMFGRQTGDGEEQA